MTPPDPWAVGRAHELSVTGEERTARGAWYTPRLIAESIVEMALGHTDERWLPSFVVDPTCGGGAFLLATLDQMVIRGLDPPEALDRVAGMDIDRGAVEASQRSLELWAEANGVDRSLVNTRRQILVGDALDDWPDHWPEADLAIGNPPFATPLKGDAFPESANRVRLANTDVLGPYADLAAIHLLNAVSRVNPTSGRVCLVLPQSLAAGRDSGALRAHLDSVAPPVRVWATADRVFDAGVRVFAPALQAGNSTPVQTESWAELIAHELGAPSVVLSEETGTVADLAVTTAGFRDEYYGLASACVEGDPDDTRPRLATVGSIDPLETSWGLEVTRFAKSRWLRPVVNLDDLPEKVRGWADRQLVPKILLPTQSKIFEPFVDRSGSVLPVTPVLAVHAAEEDLDRIAAVLLAPPVVAWAYRRWFGTALSVNAIKLAAKDVGQLPLPVDLDSWGQAADLVGLGPSAVPEIGRLMTKSYEADPELFEWWLNRLDR